MHMPVDRGVHGQRLHRHREVDRGGHARPGQDQVHQRVGPGLVRGQVRVLRPQRGRRGPPPPPCTAPTRAPAAPPPTPTAPPRGRGTPAPTAPAGPWPPGPGPRRRPPAPAPAGPSPSPGPRTRSRSAAAPSPPPGRTPRPWSRPSRPPRSRPARRPAPRPPSPPTPPATGTPAPPRSAPAPPHPGRSTPASAPPTPPRTRRRTPHPGPPPPTTHHRPAPHPGRRSRPTRPPAPPTPHSPPAAPPAPPPPARPLEPRTRRAVGRPRTPRCTTATPARVDSIMCSILPARRAPGSVHSRNRDRQVPYREAAGTQPGRSNLPAARGTTTYDRAMRSGISVEDMDREVRPQDDLFGYVNGGVGRRARRSPPTRPCYGTFRMLWRTTPSRTSARSSRRPPPPTPSPGHAEPARSATCTPRSWTRTASRELGARPVARATSPRSLRRRAPAACCGSSAGCSAAASRARSSSTSTTDDRNSDRYMPYLAQGGLGLPDESYYREETFAAIRQEYVAHVGRMLALAGLPDADGARRADHGARDPARRRPTGTASAAATPSRPTTCSTGTGCRSWPPASTGPRGSRASRPRRRVLAEVVVRQPDFLAALAAGPRRRPDRGLEALAGLARRQRQRAVPQRRRSSTRTSPSTAAPSPARPSRSERWKRGVDTVESALGEAVGQLYVERHFPPAAKARMDELVANLVEAYRQHIDAAGLDERRDQGARAREARRVHAQDRLPRQVARLLHASQVDRDDLLGNVRAGAAFETDRELAKLGSPVDRDRVAHDAADGQRLLQPAG